MHIAHNESFCKYREEVNCNITFLLVDDFDKLSIRSLSAEMTLL